MLAEIPGAAGLLLWQTLRDVLLWAATPPEARDGLFAPGAAARRRDAIASTELATHPANALAELAGLV